MATKVQKVYQQTEEERLKWEALIAARNAQESYASYWTPGSIRPARIVENEDENIVTVEFDFDDPQAGLDFFLAHRDNLPSPLPVAEEQRHELEDDSEQYHDAVTYARVALREGIVSAEVINQYNAFAKEGDTYKPQFKAPETRADNSVLLQFPGDAERNDFLKSLAEGNNKAFIAYDDNDEPLAVAQGDGTVMFKGEPDFDARWSAFHSGLSGALDGYRETLERGRYGGNSGEDDDDKLDQTYN